MINHDTLGLWTNMHFSAAKPEAAPEASSSYGRIYAFGDSLSDAGNVFTASGGVLPDPFIYSDGRFTNGRVWVQDLARDLSLPAVKPSLNGGTDFAYGGAEAGQEPLHTLLPIDLPGQLAQFLVQDPHPSANALYTLSIGGNDVIDAIGAYAGNPAASLSDVQTAVSDETSFIAGLAADGARNFAILNVPDLGKTPEEAGDSATATYLSSVYNQELASSLGSLGAADHLSIHLLDAFGLIDQAVAHPSEFGLTNVTTPVWTGNFYNPLSGTLNAVGHAAQDKFLFFDHLHPTETGHLALASLAMAALK
jgi:phospholipase/lecithinase/hemolysin